MKTGFIRPYRIVPMPLKMAPAAPEENTLKKTPQKFESL
jgi:hypothetical protein